jgi:AcrR family transcriptional regulator
VTDSTTTGSEEPSRGGLAVRKKERTRRQLAEAAAELFSIRGYSGTTIDEIAAAVDVSPRTFFRYFPTKEDLVVAIGAMSLDQLLEALRNRPAEESLQVALRRAIDQSLAPEWEDTKRVRAFLTLLRETPALRARWLEEADAKRELMAGIIATRTDSDPSDLRNLLIAGAITLTIDTALQAWADQDGELGASSFVYRGLSELATALLPK